MSKSPHFGVECGLCSVSVLIAIPKEWQEMEYTSILYNLALGLGLDFTEESNKASADEVIEFYAEHESHGAEATVSLLQDEE